MTLVDTNILIDIWSRDPKWFRRSSKAFAKCLGEGEVVINPIVGAELSLGFSDVEEWRAALSAANLVLVDLPFGASYRAGLAFREYRKRGGAKSSTLPDFFIGAHAELAGIPLLTRDPSGYRSYFPKVKLIRP